METKNFPLISVIIPVYNVEQYLDKCIESVLKQTYSHLEIILVDDGSTDLSGQKCDEYALKDGRIKVVHKKNGGLSDARNAGLDIMEGEYVTFVDSDDYINVCMIEKLYCLLIQYQADISCVSFLKVFEGKPNKLSRGKEQIHCYTGKEAVESIMYKKEVNTSAWGKLYKKKDFANIRYPQGMIFEDLATTYRIFFGQERIVYSSEPLYYYLQRTGSIMYDNFGKKRFDRLKIGEDMMRWAEVDAPELQEAAIARYFTACMQLLREIPLTKEWENDIKKVMERVRRYRKHVIMNRNVKWIDRVIALSTYLGIRPLKALGCLYKLVWP